MLPAGSHSPPRSGGCPPGSSVATDGDSGFAQWDSNFTVSTVNLLSRLRVNETSLRKYSKGLAAEVQARPLRKNLIREI